MEESYSGDQETLWVAEPSESVNYTWNTFNNGAGIGKLNVVEHLWQWFVIWWSGLGILVLVRKISNGSLTLKRVEVVDWKVSNQLNIRQPAYRRLLLKVTLLLKTFINPILNHLNPTHQILLSSWLRSKDLEGGMIITMKRLLFDYRNPLKRKPDYLNHYYTFQKQSETDVLLIIFPHRRANYKNTCKLGFKPRAPI